MAYPFHTTDAESQDPETFREATLVAIDECGETVSRLSTELLRGSDTRRGIRSAMHELTGLLDRLDELDLSR